MFIRTECNYSCTWFLAPVACNFLSDSFQNPSSASLNLFTKLNPWTSFLVSWARL